MIQDISPYRYDNAYHPRRPKEEDFLLCYQGKQALLRKQGEEIRFPTFREAQAHWEGEAEKLYEDAVYLFAIDGMHFYLHRGFDGHCLEKEGFAWENTWIFRSARPKYLGEGGVCLGEYLDLPERQAQISAVCRDHRLAALPVV